MKKSIVTAAALAALWIPAALGQQAQDWTHYVRIGGFGSPTAANADRIVKGAADTNVFGIEVDNDITGRYESFLDPTEKLAGIRHAAKKSPRRRQLRLRLHRRHRVHHQGRRPEGPHHAKDHPDWLQRNIKGEPAVFGGGVAFWVRKGDEDVWIWPYATEWREIYMEHVRKIAATGIDGIYVDIPYWMTHFDDWTDTWASFDDYTVAAFKARPASTPRPT